MPTCPSCRDEYEPGTTTCPSCDVALVDGDGPMPAQVDGLLGTFHPLVVPLVTQVLAHRRIAHDVLGDDEGVEVIVDRAFRDDLRAEFLVNWAAVVGRLEVEERAVVVERGGAHPGWFDAPTASWVDRAGRLQVDSGEHDEAMQEAGRLWGPTMVALGSVTGIFGWYAQDSATLLIFGGAIAVTGLLLPR